MKETHGHIFSIENGNKNIFSMIPKSVYTDLIYMIANIYKANIIQRSFIIKGTIKPEIKICINLGYT